MEELTQEKLKSVLHYDLGSGVFTWLVDRNHRKVGDRAGDFHKATGYRRISVLGRRYYEHQLAFLYVEGVIPEEIDHQNTQKADNRWKNLRRATHAENCVNIKAHKDNFSGIKGIYFDKRRGRWESSVFHLGIKYYLGSFETREEASEVYQRKAKELFGEFFRA